MSKFRLTYVDLLLDMSFAAAGVFWAQSADMKNGTKVNSRLTRGLLVAYWQF